MALAGLGGRVRHPAPVNQLNRLDQATPTSSYVKDAPWNHVHRDANGHTIDWDGLLCMAAEGAVAVDAHTAGRVTASPGRIHDLQFDMSGGIGVDDVERAFARGWGLDLIVPAAFDRNDVRDAVAARRHVILAVDYRNFRFPAQASHAFDHALGLDDLTSSTRGLIYDSLRTMPFWGDPDAVFDAAEALARRIRGTASRLFVGLTAARPALGAAAPHYRSTVVSATALWNDQTGEWRYTGANRIPVGTRIEVRGARYVRDGVETYPCTSGAWATKYGVPYFVPVKNVKLGGLA